MKICAITMVYRDYWAISQWYAHYSRHLKPEHLYIVAHGHDEMIGKLCPGANVITVPRDDLAGFDRVRGQLLNGLQDGLGALFDWVIRTDADELICIDPMKFPSFEALFEAHKRASALFALGINLAEVDGDRELIAGDDVLKHRSHAVFSGHYSKAWAVRRGTHMARHGVEVPSDRLDKASLTLPKGIYLVHLKYASTQALAEANAHRKQVASGCERGLPGKLWLEADQDAQNFYSRLATLPDAPWMKARLKAYRAITRSPVRDAKLKVLRAKSIKFGLRTTLPDWFKES
ncbi:MULTISPECIES: glycosyltransferase family 2 protein [unclassified Sulfitobacter]|jgi:hypothetical protein|uniref:glycosyltransferase family 2 protein n=1 Tax=unclassified Sulfitobacter TaxID=196795 RepID=UPI0007C2CF7F|nr:MULTISPECIES: glycosyltransferase family 2 protein [unclassified Sulfitobacter]KZY01306.1 glycosyl transferase family 2 [Sulfitobacter sp. HI0023]KZY24988.1 glycosyl transferase family 2 [Sulfitobacter sp. HI0040]KZZ64582.1 glycosyl transferase family 2 [Sulfitobacter sp. HI0129]